MQNSIMRVADESKRAVTRKLAFNVHNLNAVKCPPGKPRVYVFDTRTPGLALMVTASGGKSFYLYRRINGQPQRIRIGGFPAVTVEQARKLAIKWQGQIADGLDPVAERKRISRSLTLGELFERWKADHANQRLRPRTIQTDQSRFETCFGDWTGRKVGGIRESDVRAKHAEIGRTRGQVTANRAVQLLKRLFNFARIEPNPAAGKAVKYFRESTRDRFLQPAELPRLFAALDEADELIRDYVLLSLFTGQRRSNVQSMRWDEMDLERRTWTIPGEKTKAHQPISVPLTQAAMDILQRRQATNADSPYVFPGDGVTGHLVEPKAAWKSILRRAGIENLTLHDLRRSMASWMAISGTSLPVIGAALGHKSPTATAIYSRLTMDPVRQSVDTATAAMLATAGGSGDGDGTPESE